MRRDVRALTARNHPEGRFYPMGRLALKGIGGGGSPRCRVRRTFGSAPLACEREAI